MTTSHQPLEWTDLDRKVVDTIRVLAMDAVEKVGNGHPGTAMSLAPAAYLVYNKLMRHNPADPHWPARDRFILSCGHSSLTQYIQLYLTGYGLELDDLKSLRTWGSLTPGHPEYRHTPGVEVTTGPLGQGVGNAVGMAMAARRQHGLLDPDTALGGSIFDHHVYAIASDGDLQEGVASEASSLAGTQKLGNLTLLYDDNRISIEDDVAVAFNEDVAKRYEAYDWHVQTVDWTNGGTSYEEDVEALYAAYVAAEAVTDKPSFILLRTIIAWPAPTKQNTGKAHGSALGAEEVADTKKVLGFDPDNTFEVADDVIAHTRKALERGAASQSEWTARVRRLEAGQPRAVGIPGPDRALGDARRLGGQPPDLRRRREGCRHPRRLGRCPHRAVAGAARAVGRVRRPRRLQQHDPEGPTVLPARRSTPRRTSRATGSAASCTSASASTPWAPSSTASRCTATPGRTAAPSWSSATTCAPRCASPR
ncbi:MAG: transketolase family protein [Nocardioidaceae bacterium]